MEEYRLKIDHIVDGKKVGTDLVTIDYDKYVLTSHLALGDYEFVKKYLNKYIETRSNVKGTIHENVDGSDFV